MKKILLYVLCFFLLVANALSLIVPSSVEFDQTDANSTTAAKSFTINSNVELTSVVIKLDSSYNVTFSLASDGTYLSTLNIPSFIGDKTIYVKAFIQDAEESGTKTLGNILINGNNASGAIPQTSIPLKAKIRGRLHIVDFDAKMGSQDATNLKDEEKINKKLKPGDAFSFDIKVENTFLKDSEIDIDNIVINVLISGIDDGNDIEEESDEFDLNPGEDHTETFKFKTPVEVEEGEYSIQVYVEGEDEKGVRRKVSWTLSLEVEKESHDVQFYKAVIEPSKIVCGGTATLSTTIYNFGRNEEDEVKLVIKSPELKINIEEFPIELENNLLEDESKWSKSYAIPISKTQESKTYSIEMWLYFDDSLDDYRKLELNVESCAEEKKEEKKEPEVIVAVCGNNKLETGEECDDGNKVDNDGCSALCKKEEQKKEEKEQITGTVITETKEEPLSISWIILLVGVNVLVLVIVIVLIFLMFKGRKEEGEEEEKVYKNF